MEHEKNAMHFIEVTDSTKHLIEERKKKKNEKLIQ